MGIYDFKGKSIYMAPLRALASEKYNEFKENYPELKIMLSIAGTEHSKLKMEEADIIITVPEKLDALIRQDVSWLNTVNTLVVDEIHLLGDLHRGPTLEIVISLLRMILKKTQIISLSATIRNPKDIAKWLNAELVVDNWRPIHLKKGIFFNQKIKFYDDEDFV